MVSIRDARDSDSQGLMDLLRSVFSEYEGCVFDLGELPELLRPASHFRELSGRLWVAEDEGRIVGSFGLSRRGDVLELHKVYVSRDARRFGIARRMMAMALEHARRAGVRRIELWTDTRFEAGHRFYEASGFQRMPETRELHDLSNSIEYRYALPIEDEISASASSTPA